MTQMSVTRLDALMASMISRRMGLRAVRQRPRSPACLPDSSRWVSAHCETVRARRGAMAEAATVRQWERPRGSGRIYGRASTKLATTS